MLKRAFFTLYLVVVLAILVAGWGLDRLYQSAQEGEAADPLNRAFFALLAQNAESLSEAAYAERLRQQLAVLGLNGSVYRVEDFADSSLSEQLLAGEPVMLNVGEGREVYDRLEGSNLVLRIQLPPADQSHWYDVYLAVFYLILAVVIYLWVWPLVRDLRSLEQQARRFGRSGATGNRVSLSVRSPVYILSAEFNRMQQRIDELLASYREMTYAVSHELRTPLARMKFALELAQTSRDPQAVARQLDSVRSDVADMDSLINQLLSYAGFEAQTQHLSLQAGSPGALAAMVSDMASRLQERRPDLQFDINDQLAEVAVACEWNLFERVLQNLLGNAARYAGRTILVELIAEPGHYCVAVEDDGPGIDAADRERVFDSFIRLKQLPGKDTKGFGLGLAIVKRIMGWHGGKVAAVSPKRLGGARFECRWPIAGPSGDDASREASQARSSELRGEGGVGP